MPAHARDFQAIRKVILAITALLAVRPTMAAYEVVPVTNGGTIEGVVTLVGKAPAATLKITKNQDFCGQSLPDPTYITDGSGGLANVIVYLKDVSRGRRPRPSP